MNEPRSEIKIFSLEEANRTLPKLREILAALRKRKREIIELQAKVDIEELTASPMEAGGEGKKRLLIEMEKRVEDFHGLIQQVRALGCELKDLDKGLFDFYALRGNEIVYLCWMDGEECISHWHSLQEGFAGRKKL